MRTLRSPFARIGTALPGLRLVLLTMLSIVSVSVSVSVASCQKSAHENVPVPSQPGAGVQSIVHTDTQPHVHGVVCACSLGKKCGNMIEVSGQFLPLGGDVALPEMAFCGKKGLQAEVTGKVEGGKFLAATYRLIESPFEGNAEAKAEPKP